jgi:hypothetical protein
LPLGPFYSILFVYFSPPSSFSSLDPRPTTAADSLTMCGLHPRPVLQYRQEFRSLPPVFVARLREPTWSPSLAGLQESCQSMEPSMVLSRRHFENSCSLGRERKPGSAEHRLNDTHLLLVPRSRMRADIHQLPKRLHSIGLN